VVITQSNLQEKLIASGRRAPRLPTDSVGFRAFVLSAANELVGRRSCCCEGQGAQGRGARADVANTVDKQIKEIQGPLHQRHAEYRNELAKAGLGTPERFQALIASRR